MSDRRRPPIAVIGIGHPDRRDDAVGPMAIELLGQGELPAEVELVLLDGEPGRVLDAWRDRTLAIVIDAIARRASPGTIHRLDTPDLIATTPRTSSHGTGLGDALELGKLLDRRPDRLIVYGIEPADLGYGPDLTPAVAGALPRLLEQVRADLAAGQRVRGQTPTA